MQKKEGIFPDGIKADKFNILILGIGLSDSEIEGFKKASASGIALYGYNSTAKELLTRGIKVNVIDNHIVGAVIGGQTSGVPAIVSEGLMAKTSAQLEVIINENRPVFHAVYINTSKMGQYAESEEPLTPNIESVIAMANYGGRLAMTGTGELSELVAIMKKAKMISTEVYDAFVTRAKSLLLGSVYQVMNKNIETLRQASLEAKRVIQEALAASVPKEEEVEA